MRTVTTHQRGILAVAAAPAVALLLAAAGPATASAAAAGQHPAASAQRVAAPRLPMVFTRNEGQAASGVRYLGQAQGVSIAFTATGVTLDLAHGPAFSGGHAAGARAPSREQQVTLEFRGASPRPRITGAGRQAGTVNYFTGNNPARWHTRIPSYTRVVYHNLWPGIDAAFTVRDGTLRYAFTLAPGASPAEIRLGYAGARSLAVSRPGTLNINTAAGILHDQAPATTQTVHGHTTRLGSRYRLAGHTGFGFTVARAAPGATVTIDPGLEYSSYLGGSCGDAAWSVDTDSSGDQYVFGTTCSTDFPITPGAYQSQMTGSVFFVTKFNPAGTGVIYSTFVGGTGGQEVSSGVVDSSGAAYVTGQTGSADFPTTGGAFRRTPYPASFQSVVFKLSPDGSHLDYSTYLAPDLYNSGFGRAIALAPGGSVIVAGYTSSDFAPTTPGAFQTTDPGGRGAGYAARLNATGSRLIYGTYLGAPVTSQPLTFGSPQCDPYALASDAQGDAYIAGPCTTGFPTTPGAYQTDGTSGFDGLLVKLNASGTRLGYATYYGAPQSSDIVALTGVAVDSTGHAYISAWAMAGAAPATPGALAMDCPAGTTGCVAVAEFSPAGTSLVYSTYYGGDNYPEGIATDGQGHAYVVGTVTGGTGTIPTTAGAYSQSPGNFSVPFFTAAFGQGNLLYSTYFGGAGSIGIGGIATGVTGKIAIAPEVTGRTVYLGGFTSANNFPVTPGAFQATNKGGPKDILNQDAWAAKLSLPPFP